MENTAKKNNFGMGSLGILMQEAREFVALGSEINIVNPQSESDSFDGKYITIGGERKIDFTRLDYLGLGSNKIIRDIMIDSIRRSDISCPASQVVMKSSATIELEKALAGFHGMNEAIIFTSGYATNENLMLALGSRMSSPHLLTYFHDTGIGQSTRNIKSIFFVDSDSHFSLQYGLRLAKLQNKGKCIVSKFPNMDYDNLAKQLSDSEKIQGEAVRIIITDTLCSASGKVADVKRLCELAEEYDCLLFLDEAHAVGAIGDSGQGVACGFGDVVSYRDRLIIMGTLTKSFCQLGGYVTLSDKYLSWYLRVCCPQYIFSAPVPPWMANTLVKMIGLIKGDFGKNERAKLNNISNLMRNRLDSLGFDICGSSSHIVPIKIGDELLAAEVKSFMEKSGFVVSLFEHPAVTKGNALVRFSLCSDITEEEVDNAIKSLVLAREKFRF